MSAVSDPKELLNIINGALPHFGTFLRVLKKEKLSEDAESLRSRYEAFILSLEQGHIPTRPTSVICDDDSGYFSANRTQAVPSGETPEQHKGLPAVTQSGFLLRRDDKYRWHRCWCKTDDKEMKFFIFEDSNEDILIRSFSLENTSVHFLPQLSLECDKENCFSVSGVVVAEPEAGPATSTLYFAAYSESEYQQWKDIMHILTNSGDPSRMSIASFMDPVPWVPPVAPDSASTSSSNFSSNRESMVSTTSSQLCNYRSSLLRGDSPPRARDKELPGDESKSLSLSKQQQPLPSPPRPVAEAPAEDGFDDNASEGTIYESIDNLVLQFDETIRATAEAMGQIGQNMNSGKKKKKRDRSLLRQHSFFSARQKGGKAKLLAEKKAELERGERYCGYLLKKSRNASWKKKWCSLKGCIFSYQKSANDSEAHEYIVLDAEIQAVQEFKRPFAFRILCKGVSEMFFSAEDEETLLEWLSRLNTASKTYEGGDFVSNWVNWQQDVQGYPPDPGMMDTTKMREGGGMGSGAQRPVSDASLYDIPRGSQQQLLQQVASLPPLDNGLYSIPRSIPVEDAPPAVFSVHGMQFYTSGNPFDIYDVPRPTSMSPDEEGIYDDPFDIVDMEIYDYPPDVGDLGLEDSGLDSARNSTLTTATDFTTPDRASSAYSDDSWKTMSLPPLPNSARPSMVFSLASSDEMVQGSHNSVISTDGSFYDYPRSTPLEPAVDPVATDGPQALPESSLEYGQCVMRGHLYKRERFMIWNKLFCVVRNNFLECHKPQSGSYSVPTMKLFLPGSELKEGGDSKRQWVFRVKHPRREGVLMFAAESEEEYGRWTRAFFSAASIEVQPASTVEEIRITDLDMNRRWTSLEGDLSTAQPQSTQTTPASTPATEDPKGTWPRRKTFSSGPSGEDYQSDTLKRRRKFSWVKSGFSRKKGEKKLQNQNRSQPDLDLQRLSGTNFDEPITHELQVPAQIDPLRKSVSLEMLPTPNEVSKPLSNHQLPPSEAGPEPYQGYIRVQRKGADNMWVRYWCVVEDNAISCYISQRDLTLTLSIPLQGSRISEAAFECKREHSFKVWHLESGQCLYFAADSYEEVQQWFAMVTRGTQNVIAEDNTSTNPFVPTVFEALPKVDAGPALPTRQLSDSSDALPHDLEKPPTKTSGDVAFDGELMKFSHNGKWKNRYCVVKQATLHIYRASSDTSDPVQSLTLPGCSLELLPEKEGQQFVFTLHPWSSSKTHTFAAATDTAMFRWISVLRECLQQKPSETQAPTADSPGSQSPSTTNKNTLKKRSKAKTKESDLHVVSHVPASSLSSCDRSGFADVQFGNEAAWVPHWCVVHEDCLYIYKAQNSEATVKTIVLPGYSVQTIHNTAKKPHVVQLSHSGMAPVLLAFSEETDMSNWLVFLEKGTRAESHKERSGKPVRMLSSDSIKTAKGGRSKKGPLKADHNIRAKMGLGQEDSNDSSPTSISRIVPVQDNVIRRYEKRIRKTHKVANQTEQSLKQHQSALLHFKKELSRHVVKLHELTASGDPHAERRLKDVRSKLLQVDKILPYLGKYINVNRQAEMQTVAVLKESCTVELQTLKSPAAKPSRKDAAIKPVLVDGDEHKSKEITENGALTQVDGGQPHTTDANAQQVTENCILTQGDGVPLITTSNAPEHTPPPVPREDTPDSSSMMHQEEASSCTTPLEPTVKGPLAESPYASLAEIKEMPQSSSPKADYAELKFVNTPGSPIASRPRSVNYVQVNIGALGKPRIQDASESPVQNEDFDDMLTPKNSQNTEGAPRAIKGNYVQVNFAALGKATIQEAPESPTQTELFEDTLTPENIPNCEEVSTALNPVPAAEQVRSSPAEVSEPRLKSPPPQVAKKPVHKHPKVDLPQSPNSQSFSERSSRSSRDFSPSQTDVLGVLEGTPSVMDRIKALQTVKQ